MKMVKETDEDYLFYENADAIGECSLSFNKGVYIEWIEVYTPYRGKGMIREMLKILFETFQAKEILFYAKASLVGMYEHLGSKAVKQVDRFGSSDMILMYEDLVKN